MTVAAVKTAISIDRGLHEAMDRLSKRLGVSRSRLYSQAVAEFIERDRARELTRKLDEAYGGQEPAAERRLRQAAKGAFRRLAEGTW